MSLIQKYILMTPVRLTAGRAAGRQATYEAQVVKLIEKRRPTRRRGAAAARAAARAATSTRSEVIPCWWLIVNGPATSANDNKHQKIISGLCLSEFGEQVHHESPSGQVFPSRESDFEQQPRLRRRVPRNRNQMKEEPNEGTDTGLDSIRKFNKLKPIQTLFTKSRNSRVEIESNFLLRRSIEIGLDTSSP